jgi:hypothetical protein
MAIDRIAIDRKDASWLLNLYTKGRLELSPVYQRGKVWSDEQKKGLIESVLDEFPIGLVIFNVSKKPDSDGHPLEYYEVVDGQQRLTALFEYMQGQAVWALSEKRTAPDFPPFRALSAAKQDRIEQYQLPVAFLNEFEEEEVTEVFSRLQNGKPLKMGEKLKALTTGPAYKSVKALADNELFQVDSRLRIRAAHWTLATTFMKALYNDSPYGRIEFAQMREFLKTELDSAKEARALDENKRVLNYLRRVIKEAQALDANSHFVSIIGTARTIKWLFVVLVKLIRNYNATGKETAIARAVIDYYAATRIEGSPEWTAYLTTGRTGRIDTVEVRACLNDLEARLINNAQLCPLDSVRNFSPSQRKEIFDASGGHCQDCGVEISSTNFHADHKRSFASGGPTEPANGQALCSGCNLKKGAS